jgi:uncharacterized protein (TIGR00730 family)
MIQEETKMDQKTPMSAKRYVKTVCVYCGSGPGTDPLFKIEAETFGRMLAKTGTGLVYGGGSLGLMGAVSKASHDAGGYVTGIIPEFLKEKEKAYSEASETIVTVDMHQRKMLMYSKADAFVALPGGIGTLEELVEQLTWAQLGRHHKPIALLNTKGFWDPFLNLVHHMRDYRFIREGLEVNFIVVDKAEDLLPRMEEMACRAHQDPVCESAWAAPVGSGGVDLRKM